MDGLTKSRIKKIPYFNKSIFLVFKILFERGKIVLFVTLLVFLFYFLSFQFLENWNVIDTMWFLIATISTVGYGDLTPDHEISRILTILLIMISISAIAIMSTLLFETAYYLSKPKFWNEQMLEKKIKYHIIIVGDNRPITTTVADLFIEIGIQPVIVGTHLQDEITNNYVNVIGDIRSAETFVKAKIEEKCIGVVITTFDDTSKINAAIAARSLNDSLPVFILLEIRKRIETTRPLPPTVFTDLDLTVIDPALLLGNEISKYLHLGKYEVNIDEYIKIKHEDIEDMLFEFQADVITDPKLTFEYLYQKPEEINLLGYSQLETSDFFIGFPNIPENTSHLILLGKKQKVDEFRSTFCTFSPKKNSEKTLILGFGATSKILIPVLAEAGTQITVLDIHKEKIMEAQKFEINNVIHTDFFELYGIDSKEPFNYDLCIINMPKIQAIASLARIRNLSPQTKTVVTVPDAIDASYFYAHGASLVLVRTQLIAEAVISKFFPLTLTFGNGLIEYIEEMPQISVKNLETQFKGKLLVHFSKDFGPKYSPFPDSYTIHEDDHILFFHESTSIKRARYGH